MSPLFYMLKPLHCHLIYYKNIEWARLEWGHLLSRGTGNKFIQSQSSQGENLCQQDAFCHSVEQEYLKAVRLLPPARRRRLSFPSVHCEYLTTLIFTFMQGKLRFLGESRRRKKKKRKHRAESCQELNWL